MSVWFVHLSDIHFGQERGGQVFVHEDIKRQLVEDVRSVTTTRGIGRCSGIIVSGDIAFSGKASEYKQAGRWLDSVTEAAGCERYDAQLVPGNHDVDRTQISRATEMILEDIVTNGQSALDEFLDSPTDRDLLFRRFSAYVPFAEGYGSPLSLVGASDATEIQLAANRKLRFVRLNSALASSFEDERGRLILGDRQRILQASAGEEIVVLCHHPIDWFQDRDDALRFVRSRARVFMFGHEHSRSLSVESNGSQGDVAWLGAGATIPPRTDDGYEYTYSFIEFALDEVGDALRIGVYPRVWKDNRKKFVEAARTDDDEELEVSLSCPNFALDQQTRSWEGTDTKPTSESGEDAVGERCVAGEGGQSGVDRGRYQQLLLRFFRDITPGQRIRILAVMGAIPSGWTRALNESFERGAFERLISEGRLEELGTYVEQELYDQE